MHDLKDSHNCQFANEQDGAEGTPATRWFNMSGNVTKQSGYVFHGNA